MLLNNSTYLLFNRKTGRQTAPGFHYLVMFLTVGSDDLLGDLPTGDTAVHRLLFYVAVGGGLGHFQFADE